MTFDAHGKQPPAIPTTPGARAPHDTDTPAKLVDFMMQHWAPAPPVVVEPYAHAAHTRDRRAKLSQRFPGELLLVASGNLKVRANDEYYPFRACSDFVYLCGHQEPDSVLALVPAEEGHRAVLFVDPRPGKTEPGFFTDRIKGELWEGPKLGVPAAAERYQIADTRDLRTLRTFVDDVVKPADKVRILRGHAAELEGWIARDGDAQRERDKELAEHLSELRLIKDDGEIAELRNAIDLTKLGFEDVIAELRTAYNERQIENTFYSRARLDGNHTGYQIIVGAGEHACTLHWRKNNGALRPGDLLLLDAGVENRALYTADITRVLPINGKFSPAQREIYELVLASQRAALAAVKPGHDFMEPNRCAMRVLAHGLEALGILPMSADEALKDEHQFYRRYSLHNVSHMLGLDVHDCAKARAEVYKYGALAAGMVLTIEPGLYFQPDDLTVPPRYRGIGVRLEDDVLVTPTGHLNLSAHLPTEADDVERWIAEVWAR
jgi:Xaa-Pro aminopeptidase